MINKTEFERLITDGVVKVKLTDEQRQRYDKAVKTQHRVDMGRFLRDRLPHAFNTAYKAFSEKYKKNNKLQRKNNKLRRKNRGRPKIEDHKRRSESIEGCVTISQKIKVIIACEKLGISESQFVADIAVKEASHILYGFHNGR